MKTCTSCNCEKEITEFSPSKRGLFGVQAKCKKCYAALMKKRRKENPEAHREAVKKSTKKNYIAKLERNGLYRKNNPEKVSVWKAKDRLRNKARICADNAKRRTLTKGKLTADVRMVYALRDFYESMSLGEKFHVDHIIPVSKGGAHIASNLQAIPAIDNLRKGCSI